MNNKPIKIAHIIGKWVGGGVEAVVMNYYRNIDRNKIQFDFICDNDSTNIPYEEIEKLGGKVFLVPPYQKIYQYNKELLKIFKNEKYKIVHSHINTLSVFPLRIAKKANIPVRIAHSHSTTNKREWKKNLLKQILRLFSKIYATDYFACSEYAGRWLFGNKEYDKGNVYILNNAIDIDKFKFDEKIRRLKRKELNITEDTLVIGHIGRFVSQKNHSFLIDIFFEIHKQNKNAVLLLIGQGPLEEKIKEKVEKLNLKNNVKFLGQREDVNELYQAMDIFLFPSLYEGLGMVLIEAQCSALPCVCSDKIPKISKICNDVYFLSLNDSAKEWSNLVLKQNYTNRSNNTIIVRENGYDIKNEVLKLEEKYDIKNDYYNIGFNIFGVLLYEFCKWIKDNTDKNSQLLFVSREGEFIKRCFDILYPDNNSKIIYFSRNSVIRGTADKILKRYSLYELTKIISIKRNETVEELFNRLGINAVKYKVKLAGFGINLNDTISPKLDYFYDKYKNDLITDLEKNNQFKKYLLQEFQEDNILVDIGWKGSMQDLLSKYMKIVNLNKKIKGLYLGVMNNTNKKGFLFDNNDYICQQILNYSGLLEIIMMPNYGSVVGYKYEQNIIKPIFNKIEFSDNSLMIIQEIQKGILAFLENMKTSKNKLEFDKNTVCSNLNLFASNPKLQYIKCLENLDFYDNGKTYHLIEPIRITKIKENFINTKWKTAYLKKMLKINLPYDKIVIFLRKLKDK